VVLEQGGDELDRTCEKCRSTVVLHLSELIGTANHPDRQKLQIIGFFFENRLHGQFEVKKKNLQTAILGYIFI
jgi:hypothetical protein